MIGTALLLAGAAAGASMRAPAELTVKLHCGPDGMPDRLMIGEKAVELSKGEDGLNRIKAALGGTKQPIRLIADTNAPYRCTGGIIFSLQRLGISKVAFVASRNLPQ